VGLTLKIASGLILAVILLAGCSTEESAGPVEEPWVPPAGFESWSDTIAYRWVEVPACNDGPCSHFEVATRDGCPNSLNITLRGDGESVAILTDRVGPLKPDQVSRLTLGADDNAATRRVESIDCD
jgi:hypothetical protein